MMFGDRLKTNLDTDFLKIIAVISMFIDHIGGALFPQYPVFRWIGRLAFPLFCYCMTVGLLYTHDIKNYLARIGLFAIISQPFYILAFNYNDILGNILNFNIFFTLFISLLGIWSFKERKIIFFIISIILLLFFNFDYGITGLVLMIVFYVFRNKPFIGMILYILCYISAIFTGSVDNPLSLCIGDFCIGFEIFAILCVPLIYIKMNTGIKIPKMFFYAFYPAHLLFIFVIRIIFRI